MDFQKFQGRSEEMMAIAEKYREDGVTHTMLNAVLHKLSNLLVGRTHAQEYF